MYSKLQKHSEFIYRDENPAKFAHFTGLNNIEEMFENSVVV